MCRLVLILLVVTLAGYCQPVEPEVELSVSLETHAALGRAAGYLLAEQARDGSWSAHPGITAMCLLALLHSPDMEREEVGQAIAGAAAFVAARVRADGSISRIPGDLDIYSTAGVLLALSSLDADDHRDQVLRLQDRLIASQLPTGPGYGGLGFRYATATYPDISNTHWALEALHVARQSPRPEDDLKQAQLQQLWRVAKKVIASCQVPGDTEGFAAEDRGGFTYYPLDVTVGDDQQRHGELLQHEPVWGSLTYGAVKSLMYAGMEPDDSTLQAAREWLLRHFSITENPGLGEGGLYYYYYMLVSTHKLLKDDTIELPDGSRLNWRRAVINQLLSRQKGQGEWRNVRPLWMEDNPHLTTAYAMLALEMALQ